MALDTLPALFLNAVRTYDKPDAFRHKRNGRYIDVSHKQVFEQVDRGSRALAALGLAKGDRVAVLSENRLEWVVADLSILSAGCINVPIYATLPARQVAFILADSEARAIFVSGTEQLEKVRAIRNDLKRLEHVIVFDDAPTGDDAMGLGTLLASGGNESDAMPYEQRIATIGKYDWASILYTSGTTGEPKGAILNHWNFVSNVQSVGALFPVGPEDTCLSFLPLSHSFERTGGYYTMMHLGATIAYAEGMDTVPENMREVSPTLMVSVPRLYEKMYARILDTVSSSSALRRAIFAWGRETGKRYVREHLERRVKPSTRIQYRLASRLVFGKFKARTGGRLRFFVSGGAALARDIAEFFYAAGIPILEGYGLTETSPVISVNTFEHFRFGTVGRPIPGVSVQIAGDGEILTSGPNIMLGYYKKPERTKAVLEGEWFHTGDIGHLDDDGFLVITDRKKDIIVTAGGKNIAPQPIESLLAQSKYVSQIVVVGNGRKFVSALIVPNFEQLIRFADAASLGTAEAVDLIDHPKVHEKYRAEIDRLSEHLASFERIKKFILVQNEFTIEGGELTPTLKIKRSVVESKFQDAIAALYQ